MTDADRLDRVESVEAIRQLVSRYALATDSRDLDALVELFVDDVQVGAEARGRDALRTFFERSLREVGITILFVGNHVIDFDHDDHARGVVYCRGEVQVDDRWVVQAIQYRDTYERRNGVWYFVRRKHLLWYGADLGESPLGLPPANWPEHHTGRGELPEAWESWREFWRP
ncbi:MAG TPA: nuclear transport factor 2 family protein [Acidimicrobiia bacterium]|nr:nuclear transport factor 2 family protein [Acidimicrobiia bacterium]